VTKLKIVPFCEDQKDYSKALEKYWTIACPEEIERIKYDVFGPSKNLRQRKEAYQRNKKTISLLRSAFKELIIAHNKIAKNRGYKNYWEYALEINGLYPPKIDWFFKNVDSVIDKINKNLPISKNTPLWYWSEFNIPDFLDLVDKKKYLIPDDVYKMIKPIVPNFDKLIKRIKVTQKTDFSSATVFKKDTKTVVIKFLIGERKIYRIYEVLTFIHELGHAFSMLDCADSGKDPYQNSKYWHEKQAYKFKLNFEDKGLPTKVKNASRREILNDFLSTLFEYDIYTDPTQDFDKAYARAINRVYPQKSFQKKNPFYVLENGFVFRPCSTVVASIVQVELLA
jgi:hypothetical protein